MSEARQARRDPQRLRLLKPPTHNLPLELSPFIGRAQALAEAKGLLATTRLLTLTGAGGSGKTRLALHLARDLVPADDYPDGVWWVELGALTDAAVVPQAIASALGVQEQAGRPLLETLSAALGAETVLLVLDNAEHLLRPCAAAAEALLRACPGLTVLVTSREALHLPGETVWQVPPLTIPASTAARGKGGSVAEVGQYEAVRLFVVRATAVRPSFRLSDEIAPLVADLCRRLDGLPLAIELAAAWVRSLSVADIAARLDHALAFLTRGSATAPQRQQTLHAAIDWSYALLAPHERALLNRLSVFAGGFTLAAAEDICRGPELGREAILPTLADLVDKSLVVAAPSDDTGDRPVHYRLLETIRQFGHEKLAEAGETAFVQDRHLAWYLALAEASVAEIKGPQSMPWLERLETEHDNLRAALRWSQTAGQIEAGLRLAAALHWFWERRGYLSEGRAWLKAALELADEDGTAVSASARANALLGAAALAFNQGDWVAAATYAKASIGLFRSLDDRAGLALALLRLGFTSGPGSERGKALLAEALALSQTLADQWTSATTRYVVGQAAYFAADYPTALAHLEEALRLMREVGDVLFLGRALATLGGVNLAQGDVTLARARLEEALALVRATDDPRALALVAGGLGDVARCQGDYDRAEEVYQESLALHRALGNRSDVPGVTHSLGYVALGQGDVAAAAALQRESLLAQQDQGNLSGVAEGLAGLAAVAAAEGQLERAARLFGAAEALREAVRPLVWPAERFEWRRQVGDLRARLDAPTLNVAWAEGRAMTVEQAVAYALSGEDGLTPRPALARQTEKLVYGGLTAREREVARLVAQGKSNRAIADDLVIAERTAERHVANIMAKLGVNTRAQIAAWAVERGLLAGGGGGER